MLRVTPEVDMNLEALYDEPMVVAAGVNNPWTRRRKVELAELVREPWTWPTIGTVFDSLVVEAFRAKGLEPPRATVYAEAASMRIRLAANGDFLAVLPASVLKFSARHMPIKM